jgi:hypothetical protein
MDSPRSRVITVLGWICLALGLSSPLRIGLALYDARFNVYCNETALVCAYEIVLSSLTAVAGWGLIRRRRWAPFVAAVAGGATIALAAGSLFAWLFIYFHFPFPRGHRQDLRALYSDSGAFLFINSSLLIGWLLALVAVIRGSLRKEFSATPGPPALLLAVAALSSGLCMAMTWYSWIRFVL